VGLERNIGSMDQVASLLNEYQNVIAHGAIETTVLTRWSVLILASAFLFQGILVLRLRRTVRSLEAAISDLQSRVPDTESIAHFVEMQSLWHAGAPDSRSDDRSFRHRGQKGRADTISIR
jgi:hypothetical protein